MIDKRFWVRFYGVHCPPLKVWRYCGEWTVVCRLCRKGVRADDGGVDHRHWRLAMAAATEHWRRAHGYLTGGQG